MSYTKQSFKSGDTLHASQLNAMDEQISKNEVECARLSEAIETLEGKIHSEVGGMTAAQISALDGLFKAAAYTKDASAEYAAFKVAFGIENGGEVEPDEPENPDAPDTPTYTVTNNLTNVTNSNAQTEVTEGFYSATLTVSGGFILESVVVTMGGVDVTADVYTAETGSILITEITGDIVITAVAIEPQYVETVSNIGGQYVSHYSDDGTTAIVGTNGYYNVTMSKHRTESAAAVRVQITNTTEADISSNIYVGGRLHSKMLDEKYPSLHYAVKISPNVFRAGQIVTIDYTVPAGYHVAVTEKEGLDIKIIGVIDVYVPEDDYSEYGYQTSAQGAKSYSDDGTTVIDENWASAITWLKAAATEDTNVRVILPQLSISNGSYFCIGTGDYLADPKKMYNAVKYNSSGTGGNFDIIIDFVIPAGKYLGVTRTGYIVDKM